MEDVINIDERDDDNGDNDVEISEKFKSGMVYQLDLSPEKTLIEKG